MSGRRADRSKPPSSDGIGPVALAGIMETGADPAMILSDADAGTTTLAHVAAGHGRPSLEVLRAMLDGGFDVDTRDGRGQTILHEAAIGDAVESVTLIIARGGDPHAVCHAGSTPAYAAATEDSLRALDALLAAGGRPPAGPDGCGILHATRSPRAIRIAVRHGIDVDGRNADGETPLHACGDAACAAALMEHGADPTIRNASGITPVDDFIRLALADSTSEENPCDAMLATIAASKKADHAAIMAIVSDEHVFIWDDACRRNAPTRARGVGGALRRRRPGHVSDQIASGADPSAIDGSGRSAFTAVMADVAASAQHGLVVGLVHRIAAIDPAMLSAPDGNGDTPLHAAARRAGGDPRILRVLIAAGADRAIDGGSGGWLPLHEAILAGCASPVVDVLMPPGGLAGDQHAIVRLAADGVHRDVNGHGGWKPGDDDWRRTAGVMRSVLMAGAPPVHEDPPLHGLIDRITPWMRNGTAHARARVCSAIAGDRNIGARAARAAGHAWIAGWAPALVAARPHAPWSMSVLAIAGSAP